MNLGHLGLVLHKSVSLGYEYIFHKVSLLTQLNFPMHRRRLVIGGFRFLGLD